MNKEYYTIKEVSNILNIPYPSVVKYIDKGKLKSLKAGKQHLIHYSYLEDFKMFLQLKK